MLTSLPSLVLVQMKDTVDVLKQAGPCANVDHAVLVPNMRGLDGLLELLAGYGLDDGDRARWPTDEIALFTAASESFCKANTNCTIAESLERLAAVAQRAREAGLRVRGYISVVAVCPYEGAVSPERVGDIAQQLLAMGCYEVSLGDTVGAATPTMMHNVLTACLQRTHGGPHAGDPGVYAAHCHDTMGTGLANVMAMVRDGVSSVDTAVGGLGGCPYSPGATGNIDTESVVYALQREGFSTGFDLDEAARIGQWISDQLGRQNGSTAGRAILARLQREAGSQERGKGSTQIQAKL